MKIGKKGFSLVEVVVSLAILAIVGASVSAFMVSGSNSYLRGNRELTLQEEAQLTANQIIDMIIDVERGIEYTDYTEGITGDAVDIDGTSVIASDVPVAELRLYNEDNVYMLRWQGDDGSGYATANQVYLYEAPNTWEDEEHNPVSKDTAGAKVVPGNPSGSTGALMAQYVTSFSVNLDDLPRRRVVLNMGLNYQGNTYNIAETIKLRNAVAKNLPDMYPDSPLLYDWITGIKIIPEHAEVNQNATFDFDYELTGDMEAVSLGVTWTVARTDGTSLVAETHIDGNGILSVGEEPVGENVLTVTCTSVADTSKSASATVTVNEGGILSISVSPQDAVIMQGGTLQFDYSLEGTEGAVSQGVIWGVGTIDSSIELKSGTKINGAGLLSADMQQKVGARILKVTASAKADTSKKAEAFVTVVPPSNIEGKYDAELIVTNLTTYTFTDSNGEVKIGYKADMECLPTWADYLNGYPRITWAETTNSGAYSFGNFEDGDETQYTNVLYCGTQKNTTAYVQATVQLDAQTTIIVGVDITIPDLLTTVDTTKPYIDSENFVLYRNGSIHCEIKNYDKPVTWKFADLPDELWRTSAPDWEGKTKDWCNVGFGITGNYFNELVDCSWVQFPYANSRYLEDSAVGMETDIHAQWFIDWDKEYRLKLQALNENGTVIAETNVLLPRFDILFSNGEHYADIYRPIWQKEYYIQVYGVELQSTFGPNVQLYADAELQAEKPLKVDKDSGWSTAISQIALRDTMYVAMTVHPQEENDIIILTMYAHDNKTKKRNMMFIVKPDPDSPLAK